MATKRAIFKFVNLTF